MKEIESGISDLHRKKDKMDQADELGGKGRGSYTPGGRDADIFRYDPQGVGN